MSADSTTKEKPAAGAEHVYHHVVCQPLKGLRISLTPEGHKDRKFFSALGLSSRETVRTGLRAVDASPFKTVFVVEETSGEILFALSKNVQYVQAARRKNPPPPPPPPTPTSDCCRLCYAMGGYNCDPLPDGDCICYGATRGGKVTDLDSELSRLAP